MSERIFPEKLKPVGVLSISKASSMGEYFQTLKPGVLTVAATKSNTEAIATAESRDIPECRNVNDEVAYKILREFAEVNDFKYEERVVPFDGSWKLAVGEVDIVSAGIAQLPGREIEGVTLSKAYLPVERSILIHDRDASGFSVLKDFVGYKVAAVRGMISNNDLEKRDHEGIEIIQVENWEELYDLLLSEKVKGIAMGYSKHHSHDREKEQGMKYVDIHEYSDPELDVNAFAVRDKSIGLLEAINRAVDRYLEQGKVCVMEEGMLQMSMS